MRDLLRLTLTPELGPVLLARAVEAMGGVEAVLSASPKQLEQIRKIGPIKAAKIARGMRDAERAVERELELLDRIGARVIARGDPEYPPLLEQIHGPPTILYVRGRLEPGRVDRYPVAIVGSRSCSYYGIEQAERFAGVLARSGLTIVSGGARGIDTAAHRGVLQTSQARTIAVLGCGLGRCYPPENKALFDQIVDEGRGAVVSELPLETEPDAKNFPARNRIISGLSLGVLVVEAGRRSGALITARLAAEDHGREVMVIPGRVDAPSSQGSLNLVKQGGAALVTDPGDVLELLETPARHHFHGSHESRYADPTRPDEPELFDGESAVIADSDETGRILKALDEPRTLDELVRVVGMTPGEVRAGLTMLELTGRVRREGSRLSRAGKGR